MSFIINPYAFQTERSLGTYAATPIGNRSLGAASGVTYGGFFFTAPEDGELRRAIFNIVSGAAGNFHAELWSVSGANPLAQIGPDSDTVAAGTGNIAFTWAGAIPWTEGTRYGLILIGDGSSAGNFRVVADDAAYGSDRVNSAIADLDQTADIDGFGEQWLAEIVWAS